MATPFPSSCFFLNVNQPITSTYINIPVLSEVLQNHPDSNLVSYLISGLSNWFSTGLEYIPSSPLLQKSVKEPEVVDSLISDISKGSCHANADWISVTNNSILQAWQLPGITNATGALSCLQVSWFRPLVPSAHLSPLPVPQFSNMIFTWIHLLQFPHLNSRLHGHCPHSIHLLLLCDHLVCLHNLHAATSAAKGNVNKHLIKKRGAGLPTPSTPLGEVTITSQRWRPIGSVSAPWERLSASQGETLFSL